MLSTANVVRKGFTTNEVHVTKQKLKKNNVLTFTAQTFAAKS